MKFIYFTLCIFCFCLIFSCGKADTITDVQQSSEINALMEKESSLDSLYAFALDNKYEDVLFFALSNKSSEVYNIVENDDKLLDFRKSAYYEVYNILKLKVDNGSRSFTKEELINALVNNGNESCRIPTLVGCRVIQVYNDGYFDYLPSGGWGGGEIVGKWELNDNLLVFTELGFMRLNYDLSAKKDSNIDKYKRVIDYYLNKDSELWYLDKVLNQSFSISLDKITINVHDFYISEKEYLIRIHNLFKGEDNFILNDSQGGNITFSLPRIKK